MQLLAPGSLELRLLRSPLAPQPGSPQLDLSPEAQRKAAMLATAALSCQGWHGRILADVVLCYGQFVAWSSLPPADTAALFGLAIRSLMLAEHGERVRCHIHSWLQHSLAV